MIVQAEVSLYPLRTHSLSEPIGEFLESLSRPGLEVEAGRMSSRLTGESELVFAALTAAFANAAGEHHVVLTVTVSNACPAPQRPTGRR